MKKVESERLWTISPSGGSSYCTLLIDTKTDDCNKLNCEDADKLFVKRLCNNAALPRRGTDGSAGYDLSAAQECIVPAKGKGIVKIELAISFPPGMYARIAPRFGLALKKFIDVGAGVIDQDYRGEVGVVLFNHGDSNFQVKQGDRIAQLILEKIETPVVQDVQELNETERGTGGFGSTGIEQSSGQSSDNQQISVLMNVDSQDQDQSVKVKFNIYSAQKPSRVNSLKCLSDSNKPHILSQSKASRHRDFISVKTVKKMAKQNVPMFVAIVRHAGPVQQQKFKKGKFNKSFYCNISAQGRTKGVKRQEMKLKGPMKEFISVQEWEQQIIDVVPAEYRQNLQELVREFRDVFPETLPKGRPPKRDIEHDIQIEEGSKPPSRPPYKLGPAEQDELEEQVRDLLAQDFIRPSSSPYGAPVLFVPKKDGRWRMCIDYRALNK